MSTEPPAGWSGALASDWCWCDRRGGEGQIPHLDAVQWIGQARALDCHVAKLAGKAWSAATAVDLWAARQAAAAHRADRGPLDALEAVVKGREAERRVWWAEHVDPADLDGLPPFILDDIETAVALNVAPPEWRTALDVRRRDMGRAAAERARESAAELLAG